MRLTPPEQRSRPANFPQSSASIWRLGGAIALIAGVWLCSWVGIFDDDSFTDEFAYITQSYYSDLFFAGRLDDPAWLDYFAFDLQPLPKYFIGIGLRAASIRMPQAWRDAARWYEAIRTIGSGRPGRLDAGSHPVHRRRGDGVAWRFSGAACSSVAAWSARSPPSS